MRAANSGCLKSRCMSSRGAKIPRFCPFSDTNDVRKQPTTPRRPSPRHSRKAFRQFPTHGVGLSILKLFMVLNGDENEGPSATKSLETTPAFSASATHCQVYAKFAPRLLPVNSVLSYRSSVLSPHAQQTTQGQTCFENAHHSTWASQPPPWMFITYKRFQYANHNGRTTMPFFALP